MLKPRRLLRKFCQPGQRDQRDAGAAFRANRAEQISQFKAAVARDPGTGAALRPHLVHRVLLADPGFILEPDFDRAFGALRRDRGPGQLDKVFLNLQRLRIALRVLGSSGNGSLCVV